MLQVANLYLRGIVYDNDGVKNVYVAEIVTIIRVFDTTKSTVSLMNTYCFIIYSLMQYTFIVFALGILLLSLLFFVRIVQAKKN